MSFEHGGKGPGKNGAPEQEAPSRTPGRRTPSSRLAPRTIYREQAGTSARAGNTASDPAVDKALSQAGAGTPHPSGAVIHTGPVAEQAASNLGARAFTAGRDIFFGAGQYQPGTAAGSSLLAHELTHVAQSQGVAPPRPGSYQVSDPSESAEREASMASQTASALSGATTGATAGTLYRDLLTGATPAPGGKNKKDEKAGDKAADTGALEAFLTALAAHDPADALAKWGALPKEDKSSLRARAAALDKAGKRPAGLKDDVVESMLEVMGKDALAPMKEAKVSIGAKSAYVGQVLDTHDAAYWMQPMKDADQWNAFLTASPRDTEVTDEQAKKLGGFVQQAASVKDARSLFEKVYPKLQNKTYDASILKATAWDTADIQRLYASLSAYLPVQHVATIVKGFYLGTHEVTSGKASQLGYGWHHMDRVVLPKSSSSADGGGTDHDMTGGDDSGVAVAGTAADPQLTHWEGTVLHEIGHGVAEKAGGNDFAKSHGSWKLGLTADNWSKKLFDDAAADKAVADKKLPAKDTLKAKDARLYMARKIAGSTHKVAKWKDADIHDFIQNHYSDQPLYTYYDSKVVQGNADYMISDQNISGDRVYAWLSRMDDSYVSYKKEVYDNKVSWYGISSYYEWFAEVYAHYYRTGKTGTGLDATTKGKLDDIDKMKWSSKGGGKLKSPGGGAESGAASGAGAAGNASTQESSDSPRPAASSFRRLPFPW